MKFSIETRSSFNAFSSLLSKLLDMTPVMASLGETELKNIASRFEGERNPIGTPWAVLSPVTLKRRKLRGNQSNRILYDTGKLANSFAYTATNKSVTIGTDVIYATTQQFGAKKGSFGGNAPWGDIPARQMLITSNGLMSQEWKDNVLREIKNHLGI